MRPSFWSRADDEQETEEALDEEEREQEREAGPRAEFKKLVCHRNCDHLSHCSSPRLFLFRGRGFFRARAISAPSVGRAATMVLLRVQPLAAAAAAAAATLLFLLSILLLPSIVTAEEKIIALQTFRGVSICAPISVRIVDAAATKNTSDRCSSSGNGGFSARLVGEKGAISAVALTMTGTSLAVELSGDLDTGPGTLELEIALPAGTLQYVERVHAPGDTVILSEFDPEKAEVASSGAGSIWIPFLNGRGGGSRRRSKETKETTSSSSSSSSSSKPSRLSMSKISLSAPGKVVANGDAGFWEIFTADEEADVRIDGVAIAESQGEENPYSTVSVRLDAGRAFVNPAPSSKESHVSITGFALAPAKAKKPAVLEYSSGQCSARKEAFGGGGKRYGGSEPDALPALGSACDKVAAPSASSAPPGLSWSCGVRTSGSWTCGGPGLKGRPGTLSTGASCAATREQVESIALV